MRLMKTPHFYSVKRKGRAWFQSGDMIFAVAIYSSKGTLRELEPLEIVRPMVCINLREQGKRFLLIILLLRSSKEW